MTQLSLRWTALRFAVVGACATAVHVLAALAAHEMLGASPLAANAVGYACAVGVSYAGNLFWTFRASPGLSQAARFIGVSLLGMLLSEAITLAVVHGLKWPFGVALAAVVVAVPTATFVVSRFWIFRADPPRGEGP